MIDSEMPLISVGVPTYNRPEVLRRSLNSIIFQTYTNLEIIISDNCSNDPRVLEVTEYFRKTDLRVKLYRQEQNIGAAENLAFVLKKATGAYFMWLADDDWIDPDYIRICVDFLSNNRRTVAACCPVKLMNAKGDIEKNERLVDLKGSSNVSRVIDYYNTVSYNSYFYSLFAASAIPLLTIKNNIAHDWVMISRVVFKGEIRILQGAFMYRSTAGVSGSMSTLAANLKFSLFAQAFPFLAAAFNVAGDICLNRRAYRGLNLFARLKLAYRAFRVVTKRHKAFKNFRNNTNTFARLCYRKYLRN